jgi:hypothetical protein
MNNEEYLAQISIPVPCPQYLGRMRSDERTRHCALCGKNVHNLAMMSSDEVVALIKQSDGELCGLITRRSDGTLVTSDRRSKQSRISNPWQFKIGGLMPLIACLAPMLGMMRAFMPSNWGTVRRYGGMSRPSTPLGALGQCSDLDAEKELDPEGCIDEPAPDEPGSPTSRVSS